MPLINICGLPGSGKSTRAKELATALEKKIDAEQSVLESVTIVTDDDLGIDRESYRQKDSEKQIRAQQMAAVKRELSKSRVVIFDNMTYIKGFRYQLYCEARALSTPCCTLYVGTPPDKCWKQQWPEDLWEALKFRFEEPNGMTRWDSPLFVVVPEDELPIDEIWQAVTSSRTVTPTMATKTKPVAPADYLQKLNDLTSEVVKEVMMHHQDSAGTQVTIGGHILHLPLSLSMPQLTRLRRNFVGFNRSAFIPIDSIRPFFVDYLSQNLENV